MHRNLSPLASAVIIIIAAIFLFDVQGAFIKHMGRRFPVEQISLFRNLFGILPNLLVLLCSAGWHASGRPLLIPHWKLALGRGLMLVVAQMCFYTALLHMQLATATTLAFSGPLFVTLLSIPLLGHTVGWWRGAAVAVGFAGVIVVMQPGRDAFSFVAVLPIAAALFYALASLSARFFDKQTPTSLISVYSSASAMLAALVLVLVQDNWVAMVAVSDWLWFIAMGTTGGCAVFLMITAYRMADPSSLAPFEYFGIPFSFCLGWLFFGETPFDSLFPGVLLIVGGGLLVLWRERMLAS